MYLLLQTVTPAVALLVLENAIDFEDENFSDDYDDDLKPLLSLWSRNMNWNSILKQVQEAFRECRHFHVSDHHWIMVNNIRETCSRPAVDFYFLRDSVSLLTDIQTHTCTPHPQHIHTQTDRQTDRHTDRQTDGQTNGQTTAFWWKYNTITISRRSNNTRNFARCVTLP